MSGSATTCGASEAPFWGILFDRKNSISFRHALAEASSSIKIVSRQCDNYLMARTASAPSCLQVPKHHSSDQAFPPSFVHKFRPPRNPTTSCSMRTSASSRTSSVACYILKTLQTFNCSELLGSPMFLLLPHWLKSHHRICFSSATIV